MFAVLVYVTTDPGSFDVRGVSVTLETAKAYLDREVDRTWGKSLTWHDLFGGARATLGGLTYDIRPARELTR